MIISLDFLLTIARLLHTGEGRVTGPIGVPVTWARLLKKKKNLFYFLKNGVAIPAVRWPFHSSLSSTSYELSFSLFFHIPSHAFKVIIKSRPERKKDFFFLFFSQL